MQISLDKSKMYYLSAGMTGIPNGNREIFYTSANYFRSLGLKIINPCDEDNSNQSWSYNLKRDSRIIMDLNVNIILLPPWETSRGVDVELFMCVKLNNGKVYEWLGGEEFKVVNFRWDRRRI